MALCLGICNRKTKARLKIRFFSNSGIVKSVLPGLVGMREKMSCLHLFFFRRGLQTLYDVCHGVDTVARYSDIYISWWQDILKNIYQGLHVFEK